MALTQQRLSLHLRIQHRWPRSHLATQFVLSWTFCPFFLENTMGKYVKHVDYTWKFSRHFQPSFCGKSKCQRENVNKQTFNVYSLNFQTEALKVNLGANLLMKIDI